jgi:glycosyltransferase involved in cell wall biosynthesis
MILPNLLVQSYFSISLAHGTGTVLIKQLAEYPRAKMANVFTFPYGEVWLEKSLWLLKDDNLKTRVIYAAMQIKQALRGERVADGYYYKHVAKGLAKLRFSPDILYANPAKYEDLSSIIELRKSYQIPTIIYFQDYTFQLEEDFYSDLRRVLSDRQTKEIWALTPEIASEIEDKTGIVVKDQHIEIGSQKKTRFNAFGENFKTVIMGTIYSVETVKFLKRLWAMMKESLPELSPIEWLAHPKALKRIEKNIRIEPEIQYRGFLQGEELNEKLLSADLSIIPVNVGRKAEDSIAQYSLPSRISELAVLGVPMFVIASPDTATARYIQRTGIAICESADNLEACKSKIVEFMKNQTMREAFSQKAREYAEKNLDIKRYREELYHKFVELKERGI